MCTPNERLRHHVSGAIARGEAQPITEQRDTAWRIAAGDPTCVFVPGVAKPINCGSQERAKLIAAAPELLATLQAVQLVLQYTSDDSKLAEQISAAIAKAL